MAALRGLDRKSSPRTGARKALVAAELALSFILLAGAGLLLGHLWRQVRQGPGFEVRHLQVASLTLPLDRQGEAGAWARDLAARLRELPGMESAAVGLPVPIFGAGGEGSVKAEGQEREVDAWHHVVEGPVARTYGMRLLAGRDLQPSDTDGVLLSEPLARALWPEGGAVGRRMSAADGYRTVVGVVSGTREHGLDEPIRPQYFQSIPTGMPLPSLVLLLRTQADPRTLDTQLRSVVRNLSSGLALGRILPFEEVIQDATSGYRRAALPMALLAGVSALLAALGTLGLLAQLFRQRRGELGIRAALGASPTSLAGLVFSLGGRLLGAGLVLGLLGAAALGGLLRHQMPGLGSFDAASLALAALLLLATTFLACLLPALRAARVPPAEALRSE